ncbi:hypothetical protein E3N88_09219 [Mikania micrantha]|uniref:CCHC-type domain-containing protein n=1 Tax=Mikania micrantha TaxID=192012 RepID=A0A5N6PKQ1_9ASTR|nr:hypothetical protein E3N88_09219 [Mikania micrantha]
MQGFVKVSHEVEGSLFPLRLAEGYSTSEEVAKGAESEIKCYNRFPLRFRTTSIENPNLVVIHSSIPCSWPDKTAKILYFRVDNVESFAWTPRTPNSVEKRKSYARLMLGFSRERLENEFGRERESLAAFNEENGLLQGFYSPGGIRVTELKCGSIIISCAFNHQLSDGYSLNMFLVAWAKYSQSANIFKTPSFRPSILNPRHPPRYETSFDNLYIPITSLPPPSSFEEPLGSRMYHIRAESIARIQSKASTNETRRSRFLSFTSYLWKLLADGSNGNANAISRMGVVVDGRRFLTQVDENDSSLFENHYGNVLSVPYGVASNSDLKTMPLHEVANRVHGFVAETTNEEHFRGLIDWVQLHRPTKAVARIYFGHEKSEGRAVVVSSGQGLPIKDMDFGWGKPEFGSYHVPWGSRTGYVTTMPSATRNGDWVVYMHLNEEEFHVIDHMAPHFQQHNSQAFRFGNPKPPQNKPNQNRTLVPYVNNRAQPLNQYPNPLPPCTTCGKPHRGICRFTRGLCFRGGQTGHLVKDCPQPDTRANIGGNPGRATTGGRVFALTAHDAAKTPGANFCKVKFM